MPQKQHKDNGIHHQIVHIYQDSNGKDNKGNVEAELNKLRRQQKWEVDYEIYYHDTFTLPRTYNEIRNRIHSDAVIILNIGMQ